MVVLAPFIIAEPREERRLALFEDCGASGGTGSAVNEEREFAGAGETRARSQRFFGLFVIHVPFIMIVTSIKDEKELLPRQTKPLQKQ